MLTQEQKQARKTGIGGSDVAAILGLSPWKTALQVYMEKRGEIEEESENRFTKWGSILEPVILAEYEQQTGEKVSRPNQLIRSYRYPFMIANVDGLIEKSENGKRTYCKIVEIKTAMQFVANQWGEINTDQLPDHYLTQVHHYMTVLDAQEADVAVLIGGNDFRIYNVKRDSEISKMLIEKEAAFWEMVRNGIAPAITNAEDWLLRFENTAKDEEIEAADDDLKLLKILYQTQVQIKSLEILENTIKNQVLARMGENKKIAFNGNKLGAITVANKILWDTAALSKDDALVAKYKTKASTSAYFQLARTKSAIEFLEGN
jgi:putative phage-type endonuclease